MVEIGHSLLAVIGGFGPTSSGKVKVWLRPSKLAYTYSAAVVQLVVNVQLGVHVEQAHGTCMFLLANVCPFNPLREKKMCVPYILLRKIDLNAFTMCTIYLYFPPLWLIILRTEFFYGCLKKKILYGLIKQKGFLWKMFKSYANTSLYHPSF